MSIRFVIAAALLAAFALPSLAADTPSPDKKGKEAGMEAARKYISELDKNKDGSLSKDELPADMREGFADLDANKDGKLSAEELEHHAQALSQRGTPVEVISFWVVDADTNPPSRDELQNVYDLLRKADSNNDGKLSAEELKAAREQAVEKRVDAMFKRCDKNHDNKISKDEAGGLPGPMFEQADKNHDGFIERNELKDCCTGQAGSAGKATTAPGKEK
jgi:Ca2+-binding EF-hand superfamily protein